MNIAPRGSEPADTPAGYFVLMPPQAEAAQIDVRQIVRRLWREKKLLLAGALLFTILAGIHAYLLATPVYRAHAIVSVRSEGASGAGVGGQIGGLASLAGINLHGGNSSRVEFLAALRSRQLTEQLIKADNLLPILFSRKYDADAKQWRHPDHPPTMDDGVKAFYNIRQISEDADTGLVTIQIDWKDRFLAVRWTNDLIALANRSLRTTALKEAQGNLSYLTQQSQTVQVDSLRQSVVHLMETNLNQAMLAKVQPDYAFKVIDPPTLPDADKFIFPVRFVELVAGFVVGLLLASVFVLWRNNFRT